MGFKSRFIRNGFATTYSALSTPGRKANLLLSLLRDSLQRALPAVARCFGERRRAHQGSRPTGAVQLSHFFTIRITQKYGRSFSNPRRKAYQCLAWAPHKIRTSIFVAGPRGFEPRSSLLEREILPLNYRPIK